LAKVVLDTVPQPLLVLHDDLRVQSANRAFFETFQVDRGATEGRLVYELGNRQWDIPKLRRLLSEILPENHFFEGFEVEHDFETLGHRVMLLNARRVDQLQLILLAIEDITERRRTEQERELLIGELNHRVKNVFAVIRALATQGDSTHSAKDYQEILLGRMDALACTHDLLFERHWRGADLRSVAHVVLQVFAGERGEAIKIDGTPVEVDGPAVTPTAGKGLWNPTHRAHV
jgi:two-component system, chemotaxis family, CheB/CheR fusion protein